MSRNDPSGALPNSTPLNFASPPVGGEEIITPREPPPVYSHPYVPADPITYTFSLAERDAMLILPPTNALDTRPLYHISVSLNPFAPLLSTTTIRNGGDLNGTFVATLEWGGDPKSSLITIGTTRCRRSDAFKRIVNYNPYGADRSEWKWEWPGDPTTKMYWLVNAGRGVSTAKCYLVKSSYRPNEGKDIPMATFSGRTTVNTTAGGPSHPPVALQVTPEGHIGSRLICIIMGALILERSRLLESN